jgi:hypothetical protein
MSITRKALCVFYGLVGLIALVGTWGNNVQYLSLGFVGANLCFWQETMANPASRSITVDILFLALAAATWMILEARRLRMRGVWFYVIFGALVAISVTFPLFLINRERALSKLDAASPGGTLKATDMLGLAALAAVSVVYALMALAHA